MTWKLNAENRETKDGKLTRAVQEIIDCDDDNRMDILADKFGAEVMAVIIEQFGMPDRVQGVAMIDGRAVMLGDCPCKGEKCRAAWGWEWVARDLNMSGHRGSLKAEPCKDFERTLFNTTLGEFQYRAPYGMDAEQFYRFQRNEWGDVDKAGLRDFMSANLAIAEGRKSKHWRVD